MLDKNAKVPSASRTVASTGTGADPDAILIGDLLAAAGQKSDYVFEATPTATSPATQFTATAIPSVSTGPTQTGARFYFLDESQAGFNLSGVATSGSTAISAA